MPVTKPPSIDDRDFQKLLDERKSMVKLYTPEWDISDEKDAGFALLEIFTRMQEEIISRLNRVPEKNFTAFLDMLGIKLMPAQAAKVPVTFYLSEGFSGGVLVPDGTQVAAKETEKHGALVFETTNNFQTTSAVIEEIYCIDPDKDEIFCYSDDLRNKKEFTLFKGDKNLQEHVLYLGHDDLFNLKSEAIIELDFSLPSGSVVDLEKLIWEYWGDDEENPVRFNVVPPIIAETQKITLTKSAGEIKKKWINDIESRWIRCKLENVTGNSILPVFTEIKIIVPTNSIKPDIGFYNSNPLDLNSTLIYPFGTQPRLFDTFWIASREAFSKKGANLTINFERNIETPPVKYGKDTQLSWEYWNGVLWQSLPIDVTNSNYDKFRLSKINLSYKGKIIFNCPEDITEVEVNGQKNYWIRVRLINGDYGKYQFKGEITPVFYAPWISSIDIEYSFGTNDGIDLQYCIAHNNLEYMDFTQESKGCADGFKPFISLPEKYPTLYLGFKDDFGKGNISIFFSLLDNIYPPSVRPKIQWTYWSKTPNLLESKTNLKNVKLVSVEGISVGTELLFEEQVDAETTEKIHKTTETLKGFPEKEDTSKYFITENAIVESYSEEKVTLKEKLDHKYTRNASVFKRTNLEASDNTEYLTASGTFEFIGPAEQCITHKFGKEYFWLIGTLIEPMKDFDPVIKGIYPNTVWAEQVETIQDEIIGSSDGEIKGYKFLRSPVISPEISVRDGEIWDRWTEVDDFIDPDPRSRHYVIDGAMGTVEFGDGKNGMIPPRGKDNIKANYKSGGGASGNVIRNEISVLKTPVAGIDHVVNHEPSEGGADTELMDEVFERGPHLIRHRKRAVTKEDFERLSRAASSYIARTKCIAGSNMVRVIVIPKGEEDRPLPSSELKKIVKKRLLESCLNLVDSDNLDVENPSYKEIRVTVDVVPDSIDLAIPLEKDILKKLKEYFHPLTGGNKKNGWEFGRSVHISDVYALLEGIEGVDHVENLRLNDEPEEEKIVKIDESDIVCSGEHRITTKLGGR